MRSRTVVARWVRDGSDFPGDDVGRIIARGHQSKITTEMAGRSGINR
jgi:hypothetical protein